jgi:hypothetical protein
MTEKKNKILRMVDYTDNCHVWTGKQALEETLQEIEAGEFPENVLVIGVDKKNNNFVVKWCKAGMLNSDALAALQLVQSDLADILRGIYKDE